MLQPPEISRVTAVLLLCKTKVYPPIEWKEILKKIKGLAQTTQPEMSVITLEEVILYLVCWSQNYFSKMQTIIDPVNTLIVSHTLLYLYNMP